MMYAPAPARSHPATRGAHPRNRHHAAACWSTMRAMPPPRDGAGIHANAGATWNAERVYASSKPLNLGTWNTRVTTARHARRAARRYAGRGSGRRPSPRGIGPNLHGGRARRTIRRPPDRGDVRVAVAVLVRDGRDEPGEALAHL